MLRKPPVRAASRSSLAPLDPLSVSKGINQHFQSFLKKEKKGADYAFSSIHA